jgi:hypothetical protein
MKKEYVILVLVIIGLAAYLGFRSKNQANYQLPRLEKLENAKIDGLRVTVGKNEPIVLTKKDDKWFIEPQNYLADPVKVKNMIQAAADLTVTALVSESGSDQRYDLNDDARMNIQVFMDGKKIREFDLGKVAPTFQHTFAKLEGNPDIYHVKGAMKNTFDQTVANLRDKIVLHFEKDSAVALHVQKGDKILNLSQQELPAENKETPKEGEEKASAPPAAPKILWHDDQGQPADKTTVDRLLGDLSDLKCESYLDDKTPDALKDPVWTLTVTDKSSTAHTINVFPSAEKEGNVRMPSTSSDSAYVFEFPKYELENLEKNINKLLGIEEKKE